MNTSLLKVWGLAGELGLIIALPLVACVVIAVKLDRYFGTSPLFIIIGMVLAFCLSAVTIIRKVKHLTLL